MLYVLGQRSLCDTFLIPLSIFSLNVDEDGNILSSGHNLDDIIASYRNKGEALKVMDVILTRLSNAIPNMAYVLELPEENELNEWLERN